MAFMGPLSSVFDLLCFAVMWWVVGANTVELSPLFQCGWFLFGTVSQVAVIHMIRTAKVPFLQSMPSLPLVVSTFVVATVAAIMSFSGFAVGIDMQPLPLSAAPWLLIILAGYCLAAQLMKKIYVRRYGEWL